MALAPVQKLLLKQVIKKLEEANTTVQEALGETTDTQLICDTIQDAIEEISELMK